MNIEAWLTRLGLERYARAFHENDIDAEILPELTADDLAGLGVTSIGHRRKLLAALAVLRNRACEQTPPLDELPHDEVSSSAERRQLTLMFCDLVGSTALSNRLDPEDLREIMAAYQGAVAKVVTECAGFIARYMGDGVLVYFGYPQAHEDDAERAVRAGLGLIEAIARLDVGSIKLQARVGIATGLVVIGDLVGEGSAQEQTVIGETPNLAARLQALAEPNTVVIAASTRRLVGEFFEYHDLGAVQVKGISAPIQALQVLRPSALASRFEALHGSALGPVIGRNEEIDLLLRRWARAKSGNGQVVLVSGEPGIGKSRITAELKEHIRGEPHLGLSYFCSPYYEDTALFPFIGQLGRAAGFSGDDSPIMKSDKFKTLLAHAEPPDEDLALLADLLSLSPLDLHPLPELSPQRKKEQTLEALIRNIEGLARKNSIVAVFEDAHWIDPTSRELLDLVVERVSGLPVLLVITFRPEFQPPWIGHPQVTMLALNRLDRRGRIALVEQIAGGKRLPDEVVDQIVDRTDGVPLFVEELTKSVLESGVLNEEVDRYVLNRTLPRLAIPTTLQDSLMARLDRLASARLVAQIGAAIGREFSYAMLRAVSRLPEDELQTALARVVTSELVLQRGAPPNAIYSFKHALVQDVAHGTLLRSSRQQLHAQIADVLEINFPELMDRQPELFAQHYAEAGLVEKSVAYWGKAGRKSAASSAMAEAAAQFQKGLDQLAFLPDNPQRQQQELEFWSALGAAFRYAKGQAAPETGHAFARARELCEQLGAFGELLYVLYGLSRYHMYRGELSVALQLDEHLLRFSHQKNNSAGLVLGHDVLGRDLLLAGDFASARFHLEEVLTLYDSVAHRCLVDQTGNHPRVVAQGFLGIALFCLGFPDQAFVRSDSAIAEARTLGHPPSLAASISSSARLLSLGGDDAALDARASELFALASEQNFPLYRVVGTMYRGWVKIKTGDPAEGLSLLRTGSTAYRNMGAQIRTSHHIALLARACGIVGQIEEALSLLDEALQSAERIGERWFLAELHRQKGEMLLRQGHFGAAEELYLKALRVAEKQEAKLWELRTAVSLARLRGDRGRRVEARDLLAPIYAWFAEGIGTPDLKDAEALLQELS